MLSQAYERLVFYCSRGHDLEGAAAALKELEKLWTGDAARLKQIAGDFAALGDWVIVRAQNRFLRKRRTRAIVTSARANGCSSWPKPPPCPQKTRAAAQRLGD